MKKVSVIVTCYNHEKYIEQCLRSIFSQTHQNIELFIVNDGSSDNSDEVIRQTILDSPFEVTEYLFQENQGSCVSRNEGLDWATGEFILMVDSDNYLDDNHIEVSLALLEVSQKDIAYTSLKNADTQTVINEVPEFDLTRLLNVNFIDTCSLIRKEALGSHRFDLYLNRLFMQDYDFFLSLIHDGAQAIKVEGLYQNYRVLPNSVGNRAENRTQRLKWFEIYSYIIAKYPDYQEKSQSSWFSSWFFQLNHEYDYLLNENAKLNSRNFDLYLNNFSRERELFNKEKQLLDIQKDPFSWIKSQGLAAGSPENINSKKWRFKQKLSFSAQCIKNIFSNRPTDEIKEEPKEAISNSQNINLSDTFLSENAYQEWIANTEDMQNRLTYERHTGFGLVPTISILMPVYNVERKWLEKAVQSVKNQWYPKWELCIADDASTNLETISYLEELLAEGNPKIKVVFRKENGHISEATNSALEIATGEYIALLDNDDELTPNALFEVLEFINQHPDDEINLVYTDEDKIDEEGQRFSPHFKPDWSPDLILNQNYISHLGVYKTEIARKIGGFRKGFEGAQDHDFLLRFVEQINSKSIYHIPKVLYHWRAIVGSTAFDTDQKEYVNETGIRVIQETLERRSIKGEVTSGPITGLYDIRYDILEEALVSIIIPTRNGYEDLKLCIDSIIETSTYSNYEIIVADNGSDDPAMLPLFNEYQEKLGDRFTRVYLNIPFNYSRLNNKAVAVSAGKYLLFLNNDTSIIAPDWIERMLGFAQFERIGCVGAKLVYFDDTIQHGGVILGMGGIAGHSFVGLPKDDFGYFGKLYTDYNYTAVTAACMMVSRQDFETVNGFDEELEVAFNDIDLCIRIFELGKNNVWAHDAVLYHGQSQAQDEEKTLEMDWNVQKDSARIKAKYGEKLLQDPAGNINYASIKNPFETNIE
ncbi:glycosyltransferase [Enterococcus sp. LJL120]